MVKKGSKSNGKVKANGSVRRNRNWGIGAVIVALFGTFLFLVSLLSKPQFIIENHVVVLTQGIVAPAILMRMRKMANFSICSMAVPFCRKIREPE